MKVRLECISQNSDNHPQLKPCCLYGSLYDAETGQLLVQATLTYIADAIAERHHELVSVCGVPLRPSKFRHSTTTEDQ